MQKLPKNIHVLYVTLNAAKQSNYNTHLLTRKHQLQSQIKPIETSMKQFKCQKCEYQCNSRTSLWRHKKNVYLHK